MIKFKTKKLLIVGASIMLFLAPAQNVYAGVQTATANMTVTANVAASCTVSTGNMVFGAYSGSLVTTTATITATCTNGTTYNIGLSAGNGAGATVAARKMTKVADTPTLNYTILKPDDTNNWGNTVGTDTLAGTGNGSAQNLTANGKIPASQTSAVGSYTDTVVVTITF